MSEQQPLEDVLENIEIRLQQGKYVTPHQGMRLFEAYQAQAKQLAEVWRMLDAWYSEPLEDRAIKAMIANIHDCYGESEYESSREDYGGARIADERAEELTEALKSLYHVEFEMDEEDIEVCHVSRDGKAWQEYHTANRDWSLPVSVKQEEGV